MSAKIASIVLAHPIQSSVHTLLIYDDHGTLRVLCEQTLTEQLIVIGSVSSGGVTSR